MNIEDLREEIYNEVIQDHSELQYKYTEDELQDKISEIVEDRIEEMLKVFTQITE